jgi:hypothetical protein
MESTPDLAVVATDAASADADWDNGRAAIPCQGGGRWRSGGGRTTHRLAAVARHARKRPRRRRLGRRAYVQLRNDAVEVVQEEDPVETGLKLVSFYLK